MRIIFFGTPSFSAQLLDHLLRHDIEVVAVVTREDKPKGRKGTPQPSSVKTYLQSKAANIILYQPARASDAAFIEQLAQHRADLFVVVAYGEIMRQALLDLPRLGCINVHTSLLPKYRGAAPLQRCIMNGEKESGVTIMRMVRKLDAGDMIATARCQIDEDMNYGQLEQTLCDLAGPLLLQVLQCFEQGSVTFQPQDEAQVTYAEKIELEDCQINWHDDAWYVHNLVRGVFPIPGAWCWVDVKGEKKRLKVAQTLYLPAVEGIPGSMIFDEKRNCIVCCDKGGVQLQLLQLEGKRLMAASELLRGTKMHLLSFEHITKEE